MTDARRRWTRYESVVYVGIPASSSQLSKNEIRLVDYTEKTTYNQGLVADNDLVEACLDQSATNMLELFPGLYQEIIAFRDFDWDTFSSVPCPYMESRIS
jgi:hypothetical protein